MNEQRKYIIVAGINGAGKSTLYRARPELFTNTKRLNADEILQQLGGDWRKNSDNIKAMRLEVQQLHESLEKRKSIHVETTLAGHAKSQLNLIDKAHQNGYEVTLLYVAVNSAETAIKRVNERVELGGHGVEPELIKKRYKQSNDNLPKVAYYADNVLIFDNSKQFTSVYQREKGIEIKNKLSDYPWISQNLSCSEIVQKDLKKFENKNPEIKAKKEPENKKDSPSL